MVSSPLSATLLGSQAEKLYILRSLFDDPDALDSILSICNFCKASLMVPSRVVPGKIKSMTTRPDLPCSLGNG